MMLPPFLALVLLMLVIVGGLRIVAGVLPRRPPLEGASQDDLRRLADTVESLREEVERLGGSVDALDERMDFTEKLLSPPRDSDAKTE